MQWMFCPTDPSWKNENCAKRPHVVTANGAMKGQEIETKLKQWTDKRMLHMFSVGWKGGACETARSPGASTHTLGIGAVNSSNMVTATSARGPSKFRNERYLKPDLCAPDRGISSSFQSDKALAVVGEATAPAAYIAGIGALLKSWDPTIDQERFKEYLIKNADPVKSIGQTCGGKPDNEYPNNVAGWGKVNVEKIWKSLKN